MVYGLGRKKDDLSLGIGREVNIARYRQTRKVGIPGHAGLLAREGKENGISYRIGPQEKLQKVRAVFDTLKSITCIILILIILFES